MKKAIEWEADENGCWVCASHHRVKGGYPQCESDGQRYFLSRFVYEQCFGEIPEGLCVCHKCDNPPCINPQHLFLGTRKDNTQDMVKKGRNRNGILPGESNGQSKLTSQQVLVILNDSNSNNKIAAKYGVSKSTILRIKNRKSWRNITPEIHHGEVADLMLVP